MRSLLRNVIERELTLEIFLENIDEIENFIFDHLEDNIKVKECSLEIYSILEVEKRVSNGINLINTLILLFQSNRYEIFDLKNIKLTSELLEKIQKAGQEWNERLELLYQEEPEMKRVIELLESKEFREYPESLRQVHQMSVIVNPFFIGIEHIPQLNERIITKDLREEFETNNEVLSSNASVACDRKNYYWEVNNNAVKSKQYGILKEKNKEKLAVSSIWITRRGLLKKLTTKYFLLGCSKFTNRIMDILTDLDIRSSR